MRRGIGGRTVAEAARRLTYAEVIEWAAYKRIIIDEVLRAEKQHKHVIDW